MIKLKKTFHEVRDKYGSRRRQALLHMERKDGGDTYGNGTQMERLEDLLQVRAINLKDTGQGPELRAGVYYHQLLKKLNSKRLSENYRWVHLLACTESVETLPEWVAREANFLITPSDTINGIDSAESSTGSRHSPKPRPSMGNEHSFLLNYISCKR